MTAIWYLFLIIFVAIGWLAVYHESDSWAVATFILSIVVLIVACCALIDQGFIAINHAECLENGYSGVARYQGHYFCVQYKDRQPYMIPVELIEDWHVWNTKDGS